MHMCPVYRIRGGGESLPTFSLVLWGWEMRLGLLPSLQSSRFLRVRPFPSTRRVYQRQHVKSQWNFLTWGLHPKLLFGPPASLHREHVHLLWSCAHFFSMLPNKQVPCLFVVSSRWLDLAARRRKKKVQHLQWATLDSLPPYPGLWDSRQLADLSARSATPTLLAMPRCPFLRPDNNRDEHDINQLHKTTYI